MTFEGKKKKFKISPILMLTIILNPMNGPEAILKMSSHLRFEYKSKRTVKAN